MSSPKRRNLCLDVIRALSAFLVIFIHFPFPGYFGKAVLAISRVAVPLFFSISGYYFYKGDPKKENSVILRRIRRLVKLLLISEVIYFSFYLLLEFKKYGIHWSCITSVLNSFVNVYRSKLFSNIISLVPLCNEVGWFLIALIVVYGIIYVVNRYKKMRYLCILSAIIMLLHLIIRRYTVAVGNPVRISERFVLYTPLFFFLLGYLTHKYQSHFSIFSICHLFFIFLSGCILTLAENLFALHTIYIGTFFSVPSLLLIGIRQDGKMPKHPAIRVLGHIGYRHTDFIYIVHVLFLNNVSYVFLILFPMVHSCSIYAWIFPLFGCVLTTFFAVGFRSFLRLFSRRQKKC